jgi:sugar phosphate isomerase/epimerase
MKTQKHKLAIATVSLGWHSSHTLERKLDSIAKYGYSGVEIYHPDLVTFAAQHFLTHLEAATKIGVLCRDRGISIMALQPLFNFAGVLTPLSDRLALAQEYVNLARAMGTNVIQVPSTYEPNSTGDEKVIVGELRALADLGTAESSKPPISFAYETLAWGIHHASLDDAVRIVELVDRPNFGLCLDTYHVIARVWADPHCPGTGTGVVPGGATALKATLKHFKERCPVEKIFYLQLSDAERLTQPLIPGHPGYKHEWAHWYATMHWCVWGRLFPYETGYGAYFPLDDILQLWLKEIQWEGWVSMEMFHRHEYEESIGPEVLAERGFKSWIKLKDRLSLE